MEEGGGRVSESHTNGPPLVAIDLFFTVCGGREGCQEKLRCIERERERLMNVNVLISINQKGQQSLVLLECCY